jgi:endonuclease/exonuclease/phosphatase family metal-dependent hydrolase
MPRVVVASFNVHGGVDGWGRPYDVVDACRRIGADILMLQECWSPEGEQSLTDRVASQLGYGAVELTFARGRILSPPDHASERWSPRLWSRSTNGIGLDGRRMVSADRRAARSRAGLPVARRGTWSIAVLSKFPVTSSQTIDMGKLPTDPARRGAIVVDVDLQGATEPLRVVGTHLAHLSQGSLCHIATLRRALHALTPVPSVLAGDMNLWGPPLVVLLPGWSRAVRGRTWPTWLSRPVAQPDHILVRGPAHVDTGEVLPITGSDHLPIRAALVID